LIVKTSPPNLDELRILLKTITAKDASIAVTVLGHAGIRALACDSVPELVRQMRAGAGALLIAEEVLNDPEIAAVIAELKRQSAWSDLPVLLLARAGAESSSVIEAMDTGANITVIERPMRIATLISSTRSALRARKRQYELREMLDGLRIADQRKSEFLATLAHELRNPLAPLSSALTILALKSLSAEDAKPYHEMMSRQVQHMTRLISDLMEVSRITLGKIELQTEILTLDGVVRDAIELSRPLLDGANHVLQLDAADANLIVRGDAVRLAQVFSNLLNNAAKYTPNGGIIDVEIRRVGEFARVRVRDNGIGIADDMLDSIFDMFVQVGDSARVVTGGLGIGLTLVKSLVELHGGRVGAGSAGRGKGTEITVELPLAEGEATLREASKVGPIRENVLVVDDNREAADMLAILLQTMGAKTWVAYNAEEALRAADAFRPSIAFLDIGMPGMDGCELAQRLRASADHAAMLLIAVTGWGQTRDRDRIALAGFDHHLLKPLDITILAPLLEQRGTALKAAELASAKISGDGHDAILQNRRM
jgi:signal transduction histidine kinase/ActR/RegA family two-component response regulator